MKTEKLIAPTHQLGVLSERLMMTTRWYPCVVVVFWFFVIATFTKHFL